MRKLVYALVLIFILAGCSTASTPTQKEYVGEVVNCNTDDGALISEDGSKWGDFFAGENGDVLTVKYYYDEKSAGTVEIHRKIDDKGKIYFLGAFDKWTRPFSVCRKLKTVPRYF
ncbi:MAG: lipoprotein [Proteobacteria bacterium]|nr:lipoprotein [Pseudomonadota bacterium]